MTSPDHDQTQSPGSGRYSWADMARQLVNWDNAAHALNAGDAAGVCAALAQEHDTRDAAVIYREALAIASLGAHLAAAQVARVHRRSTPPPPGHTYVLVAEDLNPEQEPSAAERVAINAVLIAATGDFSGVLDLVMGYAGPDAPDARGLQRIADLTMELLRMYVVYARMEPTEGDQK